MKVDTHGYQVMIGVGHHKIHHGEMFTASDIDTSVDTATPKYWRIHTPADKIVHIAIKVSADNDAIAQIYRAPTVTGAGTGLNVINRNENSVKVPKSTVFYDTTVSNDGTLRETLRVATGTNNPNAGQSTGERGDEMPLLPNTDYTIKVTTGNNGTSVEMHMNFYEDTH